MGVDKPNYTQIPNLLLDDLMMHMGEAEIKVTFAIARLTFGYHRDTIEISLSDLKEITHLSRQGVINGINAGLERGTIGRKEGKRGGFVYELIINGEHPSLSRMEQRETSQRSGLVNEVDYSTSQRNGLPLVNEVDQTSQRSRPALVNEVDQNTPTLKKVLKKVLKKEERKGEREQPPAPKKPTRLRSRNASQGNAIHFTSPHVDNSHFDLDTGYIRPGSGTTAVEIFYERFDVCAEGQRLTPPMEDDLVRLFPDLDKLREVVTAYNRAGFKNQRNVQLILDWYQRGIPDKHSLSSKPTSKVAASLAAIDAYELLKERHGITP